MSNPVSKPVTVNPVLVASLQREYDRAIRREENAGTERQAWRLAAESERALRRLQAARAGLPMPPVNGPRNPKQAALDARRMAQDAFAALAALGRSIARALQAAAALRKAHAANALRRAAAAAARVARRAIGSVIGAVARRLSVTAAPVMPPPSSEPARLAAVWTGCPLGISGTFAAREAV